MDVAAPSAPSAAATGRQTGSSLGVPPVVTVLVCRRVRPGLDRVLAALASQDMPGITHLVLDATPDPDAVALAVGDHLPGAFLRRTAARTDGEALDEVLHLVDGAAFFVVVRDDVVADHDAARRLVAEAVASNAGIVGAKVVDLADPRRLWGVGGRIDKTGEPAPFCVPGERDQEQHDAVRDVFVVDDDCWCIRADLLAALGGPGPELAGPDALLDLCWRAHVAGARVLVAPDAVVARPGRPPEPGVLPRPERLAARNRLRAMLVAYGPVHLARVLPQAALAALVAVVGSLVRLRTSAVGDVVHAWSWNLVRVGSLRRRRRALKALRVVPDREVRALQVRGSARLAAAWRGGAGAVARREQRVAVLSGATRSAFAALRAGRSASVAAWVFVALVFVVGGRHLLTRGLPVVGEFLPMADSAGSLLADHLQGWRRAGLGGSGASPTAVGLLGLLTLPFFGATGLARTVVMLGPFLLGLVGVWRLTRPFGHQAARVAGLLAALATPVGINAIAAGQWRALVVWAATPFVVARFARLARLAPWGPVGGPVVPAEVDSAPGGAPGAVTVTAERPAVAQIVGLGLILAVVAAVTPFGAAVLGVVVVGLVVGSLLAGGVVAALRGALGALAAVVVAVALGLPWLLELVRPDAAWSAIAVADPGVAPRLGLVALLQGGGGPVGSVLTVGLAVAAAVAVVVGRSWRFAWAVRAWVAAAGLLALAWVGDAGLAPVPFPAAELTLAPLATLVAVAVACGGATFAREVKGATFTLAQPATVVGAVGLLVATLPILGATRTGRFDLPTSGLGRSLAFTAERLDNGSFRTVWLGAPRSLPQPGWWLADGLAWASSLDGAADWRELWPGSPRAADARVGDALRLAAAGETTRLGRLLAPTGVRYLAVPVPGRSGRIAVDAPPDGLLDVLASQIDLRRLIGIDDQLVVYENTAWVPVRARVGATDPLAEAARSAAFAAVVATPTGGAAPVLDAPAGSLAPPAGRVGAGEILLAQASDPGWRLVVDGVEAPRRRAFGWSNVFTVERAGTAELRFATAGSHRLATIGQALVWLLALAVVARAVARGHERLLDPDPPPGPSGPAAAGAPVPAPAGPLPAGPSPVAVAAVPEVDETGSFAWPPQADDIHGLAWADPAGPADQADQADPADPASEAGERP